VASDRLPSARIAANAKTDLRVMFLFLLVPYLAENFKEKAMNRS
jgi:hypothetical protein